MFIPNIVQIELENDWNFYFYEHIAELLLDNNMSKGVTKDNLKQPVMDKLNFWMSFGRNFKTQIFLEGANFLLNVNSKNKELRLASVRLSNEIFILDQIESNTTYLNHHGYQNFKNHVGEISSSPLTDYPGVTQFVTHKYDLIDLKELEGEQLSQRSEQITAQLLSNLNTYSPILFERVSDFALSLTARFALLRIHLLKFIAILPSLDHDLSGDEVKRILLEALKRLITDSKKAKRIGAKGEMAPLPPIWIVVFYFTLLTASIIPAKLLAGLIRSSVKFMAKRFIAGENISLAQNSFRQLFQTGRDVTLDQLGELVVSEKEADHYKNEVLNLINGFSMHVKKGDKNIAGVNRAHVSIKVSALCSDFKPEAFDYTYELVAPRLREILLTAKKEDVFINIDAEHYHYRDVVFDIYKKVLLETDELRDYQQTGIVLQAYLRDAAKHLDDIISLASQRGLTMPIRLVKGAYWDAETVEAEAHGHDAPEFLNKEETDINFRQIIYKIYQNYPHIQLCIASHNFSDHAFAHALRELNFQNIPEIEHQCLHMTYEALSVAMAKMGWATRNYVPIGSLLVGMAYLVRRIMENSSQVGVLTIMRSHKKKSRIESPVEIHEQKKSDGTLALDNSITSCDGEFINIPILRTYVDFERETIQEEIDTFKRTELSKDYQNAHPMHGDEIEVLSPNDNKTVVGRIKFATLDDATKAIESVDKEFNFGHWGSIDWVERVSYFVKAAELMHIRRNKLSALIMMESGKALNEALADVDEAIDFINFYIRQQRDVERLAKYYPRGPVAVIAPWNFPLAIPCGMTVSSLIAGNTVVLKSAEQTPLVTSELVSLLHECGIPRDAVVHLPGVGEVIGQHLLESHKMSGYVFTGSKPVGVHISKTVGARMYDNQRLGKSYPVKVITEMGGKNGLIVTNNAELDETVSGILYSAFAHGGQKCSACSRVIVDNKIKSKLAIRLKEAISDLKVGASDDFSIFVNPLITAQEKSRLISQVEEATKEAKENGGICHIDRSKEDLPGNAVGPSLFELPKERALMKDSYAQRELFAPVIHIIGFDDLDEAIEIFNSVEYGLTGGVFSQSQDDIDYLMEKMEVGNIYINRPITGARVSIEPFGGFKMSGTGPKAGGVDYIKALQVNPILYSDSVKSIIETGSDYEVKFSRPSGLNIEGRIERVIRALDAIVSNFGPLFPGIFGDDKTKLGELRSWLAVELANVVEAGRKNREIPGQLNFSQFNSVKEVTLFVAVNERPNINSFIHFLMALASGSGVTVLSTNQKSYIWWRYLIDILVKNGVSKRNVDCYFIGLDHLKKLDTSCVDVAIVDADRPSTEVIMGILNEYNGINKMVKVMTNFENYTEVGLDYLFMQFMNERSFAINTMRHGAPMEVQL